MMLSNRKNRLDVGSKSSSGPSPVGGLPRSPNRDLTSPVRPVELFNSGASLLLAAAALGSPSSAPSFPDRQVEVPPTAESIMGAGEDTAGAFGDTVMEETEGAVEDKLTDGADDY